MKRTDMVATAIALSVAASAFAQAPRPPQDPAKTQVETFQIVLRNAVDAGARSFAQRALEVLPFPLASGDSPVVSGVFVREEGHYYFQVQVPELLQTGLVLNQMMPAPVSRSSGAGSQPIAENRVSSAGTVQADPTVASPAVGSFDPSREYTAQVSEALVDAVLDNWSVLPIQPTETLVIIAGGADEAVPGVLNRVSDQRLSNLYQTSSRKLVLTVKGGDLNDFRAGKISRDEARRRMKRSYF